MNDMGKQESPQAFLLDFDSKHRVVRMRLLGRVTNTVLESADITLRKFLAENRVEYVILDFSGVSSFPVTSTYLRSLALKPPPDRPPKLRIAVAPQLVVYGMGRMYAMLVEESRTDFEVVKTMEEAETRLALGSLHFESSSPS